MAFFTDLFTSVTEWALRSSANTTLLLLSLAGGVLLSIYLLRKIFGGKQQFLPRGRITAPQQIRNMLEETFAQRRPFEMQLLTQAGKKKITLRCLPETISRHSLTFEVDGLKQLSDHWRGHPVELFFRLAVLGQFSYFTFPSTIEKIDSPRPDVCHIIVPVPEVIESRQQRSFLRIEPPSDYLFGAALWYDESMPEPDAIGDLSQWSCPVLLYLPPHTTQFKISDMSAGGLRLRISHHVVKKLNLKLSTVDRFILMLDLFDPRDSTRIRYWVQCRTQRIMVEPPDYDVHLGAQFLAWGRPRMPEQRDMPGAIEWFRLSLSNEIEPIGNWIMHRHLAMFREEPANNA